MICYIDLRINFQVVLYLTSYGFSSCFVASFSSGFSNLFSDTFRAFRVLSFCEILTIDTNLYEKMFMLFSLFYIAVSIPSRKLKYVWSR